MSVKRILFPTDFSHFNDAALDYASTLAAEAGALLYVVHVDERYDLSAAMGEAGYVYPMSYDDDDRTQIRNQLTNTVPTVPGVYYEHHYLQGSPVTEIVKFAKRERINLIVMASHGRTGLTRLLLGSIAEGVLRGAPCPVLVVKQPAESVEPVGDFRSHVLQE
jgi:nucleotide-binding universal stress UspA family protein